MTGRGVHSFSENLNFKKQCFHIIKKSLCISVIGVDLPNGLGEKLKGCSNIKHLNINKYITLNIKHLKNV